MHGSFSFVSRYTIATFHITVFLAVALSSGSFAHHLKQDGWFTASVLFNHSVFTKSFEYSSYYVFGNMLLLVLLTSFESKANAKIYKARDCTS